MQQTAICLRRAGWEILVHDEKRQQWPTPYLFTAKDLFLEAAKASTSCILIVDEGWKVFTNRAEDFGNQWLCNESRHQGHTLLMGSQRPNQVLPSVRSCFETCFCFALPFEDAKEVVADFGFEKDLAERIRSLQRTLCVKLEHFGEPVETRFSPA